MDMCWQLGRYKIIHIHLYNPTVSLIMCLHAEYCTSFSSLQSPEENSALLCPIEEVRLNYSIVELEVEVNSSLVVFPADVRDYIITPLMPGTSYTVTVWFINEVGESLDNPTSKQDKILVREFSITLESCFTMDANLMLIKISWYRRSGNFHVRKLSYDKFSC